MFPFSGKIFGFQKDFFFSDPEIKKVTKKYKEKVFFLTKSLSGGQRFLDAFSLK